VARNTSAARRYAEAAFELASRDKAVDAWAEGLDMAAQIVADDRIRTFLDSPAAPLAAIRNPAVARMAMMRIVVSCL